MWEVELSGVLEVRAATLYRLQYDLWHKNEPPFTTRACPMAGPLGFSASDRRCESGENQSRHHSHVLPVIEYKPYPLAGNASTGQVLSLIHISEPTRPY